MKIRTASLISYVVFLMIVGQALADVNWCDVDIVPEYPTSNHVVDITLHGEWSDSCIPDGSDVSLVDNNIYFDVTWSYPPTGCLAVIMPWKRKESVGPLSPGTFTVYARMVGYFGVTEYEWLAEFIVTDYQFVISPKSLMVPEGATATFTVALLSDPGGTVEVTVAHESGDTDIAVQSGASLMFETWNYPVPQTVTLAAYEDEDCLDGTAAITVSAPNYLSCEVTASETDNDTPHILYVDIDATGDDDGRSWTHAFADLQEALNLAAAYSEVEEIRVAQGVYTPAEPNGDRHATFKLSEVTMEGGYAGFGERNPDARDINAYKTTLSGDLNGNDGPNFTNRDDNSYHVVIGKSGAVLDGFTVAGGDGSAGGGGGGGIANGGRNTTVINCIITNNRASYGGGLYNYGGSPTLINCIFNGNEAKPNTIGCGGGMYSSERGSGSSPTLINCTFVFNSANSAGGGLCNHSSGTNVTNCIFWGNNDSGGTDESAQIYSGHLSIKYSCVQSWSGALGGVGNIGDDPFFADPCNDDYHLKSQAGRWQPSTEMWVQDGVTSSCIDAGDPMSPIGPEPFPNGGRINMGAYSGTAEASKSYFGKPACEIIVAGDVNGDCRVNFLDFRIMALHWLEEK